MTDTTTTSTPPSSPSPSVPLGRRRKLEDLTPEEIREIGAEYGVDMSGESGTLPENLLVFVGYNALLLFAAFVAANIVGILIKFSGGTIGLWTLGLWIIALGTTHRFWLVWNPKFTALITTNAFSKVLHPYGVGIGIKKMWETYDPDQDYIDLTGDLVEGVTQFLVKNGVPVDFGWAVQFAPFLPMLPLYVRMENRVLEVGLDNIAESVLSHTLAGKTMEAARKPEGLDLIRKALRDALAGDRIGEADVLDIHDNSVEERFGIKAEYVTLTPPRPDEDYKEMLLGSVKVRQFEKDAKRMAKPTRNKAGETTWAGLSPEKSMRTVQIANKEPGVTDEALTFGLTDTASKAAGDVADVLRATGPLIAKAVKGRRSSGKGPTGKPPK